jgi:hypothetical protein
MKAARFIILLIATSLLLQSCSKDEEIPRDQIVLKMGPANFYRISYIIDKRSSGIDTLIKIRDGLYEYNTFNQDYMIDTIMYIGYNRLFVSKSRFRTERYPNDTNGNAWGKKFEMKFRNTRIAAEDSIVGEYYDTYYYSGSLKQAFPDSGFFAIKILE